MKNKFIKISALLLALSMLFYMGLCTLAVDIVEGGSEVPTITFGSDEDENEGTDEDEAESEAGNDSAGVQYIFDEAGVLDPDELSELEGLLSEIAQRKNINIAVAFVEDYSGYFETFCADFYESHFGRETDGVLLTVSFADRDWDLNTSGICKDAYGWRELDDFEDEVIPYLSNAEYASAVREYAEHVEKTLDNYAAELEKEDSFPWFKILLISFAVGFIIALISVGAMKGQLKSVRAKNNANSYIKSNSLNVTGSSEIFLYRNVVKTPRQTQNSGSGGGSRHSSSGGSYGGRSGKF